MLRLLQETNQTKNQRHLLNKVRVSKANITMLHVLDYHFDV